jgi:hypothetical protein
MVNDTGRKVVAPIVFTARGLEDLDRLSAQYAAGDERPNRSRTVRRLVREETERQAASERRGTA